MSHKFPRRSRNSGFTFFEAIVSLTVLLVVMITAMSLLFTMKTFAERQQFYTAPRQTARRAMEFVALTAEGATDLNFPGPPYTAQLNLSPNAVVARYRKNASLAAETRTTYDNLTTAQAAAGFGDAGTDIITFSVAPNPVRVSGLGAPNAGGWYEIGVLYSAGCSVSVNQNVNLLADLLGAPWWRATGKAATNDSTTNPLLLVYDPLPSGRGWAYCHITGVDMAKTVCGSSPTVTLRTSALQAGEIGPPGAAPLTPLPTADTVYLVSGVQYLSFRVRGGNLEQKSGMFDPVTDNPGTSFTPIVEDVEDFQVAYVFQDGSVVNDVAGAPGAVDNSPIQAKSSSTLPAKPDIASVVALRLSVTARSPVFSFKVQRSTSSQQAAGGKFFRPASENHVVDSPLVFDNREHFVMTTMVALRNRMLGY